MFACGRGCIFFVAARVQGDGETAADEEDVPGLDVTALGLGPYVDSLRGAAGAQRGEWDSG